MPVWQRSIYCCHKGHPTPLSVNARLAVTPPFWRLNIFDTFGHPVDMYNPVKQRPYWATLFDGWNVNSLDFTTNSML
jgi:hypothetical protein